jgi:hypothetical protein
MLVLFSELLNTNKIPYNMMFQLARHGAKETQNSYACTCSYSMQNEYTGHLQSSQEFCRQNLTLSRPKGKTNIMHHLFKPGNFFKSLGVCNSSLHKKEFA